MASAGNIILKQYIKDLDVKKKQVEGQKLHEAKFFFAKFEL